MQKNFTISIRYLKIRQQLRIEETTIEGVDDITFDL